MKRQSAKDNPDKLAIYIMYAYIMFPGRYIIIGALM